MRNELSRQERKGPLVLTKNKSYPAYQLYATTAGKAAPENVLIISILETMKWLRLRFKEFEVPDEIKLPDPSEFEKTSTGELKSFYINKGYKLVVIWIPEDKNWCMQLTEPDLGPRTVNPEERLPVPGRLIETNIAYREISGTVECGFKVVISEPEDESAPCEVYRLAVVKQLVENPLIGLLHKYPLSKKENYVNSSSDLKKLSTWLKDETRMLPAIIALGRDPNTENQTDLENNLPIFSRDFMSKIYEDSFSSMLKATPMESLITTEKMISNPEELTQNNEEYLIDVGALANSKMGYGQYFCVPFNLIDALNKNTNRSNNNRFKPGDLLIWEPKRFNPQSPKIYSAGALKNRMSEIVRDTDKMIQNYPLGKHFDFGDLLFFDIATIREKELDVSSDTKLMEIKKE